METPEEVRDKLSQFAEELEGLSFPTSPISLELAGFVASSIRSYLSGDQKSLDAAFGLGKKRGAPGDQEKRRNIAKDVFLMKLEGNSWKQIADTLSEQGCDVSDERTLRRYLDEYLNDLMSEEVNKRLDSDSGA